EVAAQGRAAGGLKDPRPAVGLGDGAGCVGSYVIPGDADPVRVEADRDAGTGVARDDVEAADARVADERVEDVGVDIDSDAVPLRRRAIDIEPDVVPHKEALLVSATDGDPGARK